MSPSNQAVPVAGPAVAGLQPAPPLAQHSLLPKILLAGCSNMIAACFTNPFDLVKVRQQLSHTTVSSSLTATTTTHSPNWYTTLVNLVRTEGMRSVYKGLSASLLREGTYSGIRMGGYDACKAAILAATGDGEKRRSGGGGLAVKLGGGMASGMIGAAIANPADLLKVRMQTPNATGSLAQHFTNIIRTEGGIKGLYRAVGPTVVRAGILTSSQLGTYDFVKYLLLEDFPNIFREGFATHLAASGAAGFVCSAVSAPVDVVKTRIMADKAHKYRGSLHCVATVFYQEGVFAFYRGFAMSFLRLWPHSVLSLLAFEQLRKLSGIAPI
ncbi:hypothetical protein HDU87_005239 [Geranomyces variabilis]|uniref:Mitochondrial carrier n=1 Tax=Geranomyces variabilis TaxID=109894 RepID=A0AAD5XRF8_9FUNG|nr:hypothetical protein HDU87_005239 [Geranomyces variabilis]